MNVFLQEFSLHLGDRSALLVLDGAGWHKSHNLNIPTNIKFISLPAYSPELNPTEKFWEYVKNHTIKNKVFDCIKKLENVT
jgi:transposase